MILTPRQKRLYKHRANIYKATTVFDGSGVPTTTYSATPVHSNVPCHFEKNHSSNNPSAAGRVEYDITITKDTIYFPIGVEIDDTYYVKNITRDRSGASSTNTGRWWVVQGQPETTESVGGRSVNNKSVTAIQVKTPPSGLS